jgi:hypothetical protein
MQPPQLERSAMKTHSLHPLTQRHLGLTLLLASLLALQGCTVLSVADAVVSGTVDVISTGVHATTSAVKALLPN